MKSNSFSALVFVILVSVTAQAQWVSTSGPASGNVTSLVSKGNTIFIGCSTGVFKTTDGGGFWESLPILANSLAVSGNNIIASGGSKVNLSTDDGASWTQIRNNVSAIFAVTVSGGSILAAEDSYLLLRSTDFGTSWNGVAPTNVRTLGSNGNFVYASSPQQGIFVSSDNGAGFGISNLSGKFAYSFASNGNSVFCGTSSYGVYHSTDFGYNWVQTSLNNTSVYSVAVSGSYVFAGTSTSGVYMSSDNGLNWNQINDGLESLDVEGLLIFNNYIYAGTNGHKVWKRPLSELLAISPVSTEVPNQFNLFQNYPNPFNPSTKIKFDIPEVGNAYMRSVHMFVYDALGREAAVLVNESLKPGSYEIEWNSANQPSGVYFYTLSSGDFKETKKMILLK